MPECPNCKVSDYYNEGDAVDTDGFEIHVFRCNKCKQLFVPYSLENVVC